MPGTIHGWITCTRPAACRPSHPRTKAKPTRPPGASANHRSPIFSTELPSPLAHCGRLPGARAYSYTSPAGRSIHSLICLDSRVTLPPSQMPVAWLLSKTDTWDSCRCGRYSPGCYACHGEPAPGKVTIAPASGPDRGCFTRPPDVNRKHLRLARQRAEADGQQAHPALRKNIDRGQPLPSPIVRLPRVMAAAGRRGPAASVIWFIRCLVK